ncbi:LuxR family two component transcriptional regulator [Stackebrandtia albiflava]|uniref:LuxR family two component transcriptional regulator n=1 Tax=Stackebrandtia albiflava TaxID=406432 RepID=A0A562VAE6_9ACTN|nr:response regulator transcription factor [Stackebrandtia albiflava]TWJ14821.1 LuxR family two component transcriptional regulator [Stackebrandtia albiflava]
MRVVLCDPAEVFAARLAAVLRDRGDDVTVTVEPPARPRRDTLYVMDVVDAACLAAARPVPLPPLLLLTDRTDGRVLREAVALGAIGVARWNAGMDLLVRAVDRIRAGQQYVDPLLLRASLTPDTAEDAQAVVNRLTGRERDILAGIVAGMSTRAMAARLGITPATVRSHVQKVLAKLEVHSRMAAAAFVLSRGLDVPAGDGEPIE